MNFYYIGKILDIDISKTPNEVLCKWFDSEESAVWVKSNDIVVLEENKYDQINNDPLNSYVKNDT